MENRIKALEEKVAWLQRENQLQQDRYNGLKAEIDSLRALCGTNRPSPEIYRDQRQGVLF